MRYKPSAWGAVALLMRDSTYKVLEAVSREPKGWAELVRATGLTEPGLLKVLNEMKIRRILVEVAGKSETGKPTKKYALSERAESLRLFQTAKLLKKKLEQL